MAKKVKMADIAEKLGVSVVTVSKALAGQKGVSDEMKLKIIRLASELGYEKPGEKNDDGKSYNIGVVVPEAYIAKYETFYWALYQEINAAAAANNSFVLLEIINTEDEKENIPPKLLKESKIDALIVMGALNTSYLKMLRNHYATPTVYLDFYDSDIKEDSVISNGFYGTYAITNYLLDLGIKKIAFVGTLMATKSINDRYLGYSKALMEKGMEFRRDWIIPDRSLDRTQFTSLELPEDMPEAFVCNCDSTARYLIYTLAQKGIRVPDDVKVTGFDDFIHPGLCDVPLTTYSVNMIGMAESAVRNCIRKLNGIETNKGLHLIEGKLIIRESTK